MPLEPTALAGLVSESCGLPFEGRLAPGGSIQIHPSGLPVQNTFSIHTTVGWRNVEVTFVPGSFAGDFVRMMSYAGLDARNCCAAVLTKSMSDGAAVTLKINGRIVRPDDVTGWDSEWTRLELSVRRGQLDLGNGDEDNRKIAGWTQQVTAAIIALLPIEQDEIFTENIFRPAFPKGRRRMLRRTATNATAAIAPQHSPFMAITVLPAILTLAIATDQRPQA